MAGRRVWRALAAAGLALGVAACEAGSRRQGGDPDAQTGTSEQEQGTIINDTTPHRPGGPDPSRPAEGGG